NLALQMSECERLQAELKKIGDENETLNAKADGNETSKNNAAKPTTRPASKRTAVINRKRASPSPSPSPGTSQKKAPKGKAFLPARPSVPATSTTPASTSSTPANNRKRGRPAANATTTESTENKQSSPSPPPTNEEDKPAFNPSDFIPRRAAAAKRIRYF
uniref:Uncharacterized protein n=1 Tax=Panagrolaimus sp. PS1159 TaxID=55785 RepID=A0AC35GLE0_9BILA